VPPHSAATREGGAREKREPTCAGAAGAAHGDDPVCAGSPLFRMPRRGIDLHKRRAAATTGRTTLLRAYPNPYLERLCVSSFRSAGSSRPRLRICPDVDVDRPEKDVFPTSDPPAKLQSQRDKSHLAHVAKE
jgi:hypothetical protein